jgi:hypothetical protein
MDIREMVWHIREGRSDRQIGKDLEVDRRTVKRYRRWAQEQGLLAGDLPDHESLLKILDVTLSRKSRRTTVRKPIPIACGSKNY